MQLRLRWAATQRTTPWQRRYLRALTDLDTRKSRRSIWSSSPGQTARCRNRMRRHLGRPHPQAQCRLNRYGCSGRLAHTTDSSAGGSGPGDRNMSRAFQAHRETRRSASHIARHQNSPRREFRSQIRSGRWTTVYCHCRRQSAGHDIRRRVDSAPMTYVADSVRFPEIERSAEAGIRVAWRPANGTGKQSAPVRQTPAAHGRGTPGSDGRSDAAWEPTSLKAPQSWFNPMAC